MSIAKYWELHAPEEQKKKKKTLAAKRNWIVKDTGTAKLPSGFSDLIILIGDDFRSLICSFLCMEKIINVRQVAKIGV